MPTSLGHTEQFIPLTRQVNYDFQINFSQALDSNSQESNYLVSPLEEASIETPLLTFYYTPWCYYCQKVLKYLNRIHKELPLKDVDFLENRYELLEIGGKAQVPCLVIDGESLYESNDIIAWISANQDLLDSQ